MDKQSYNRINNSKPITVKAISRNTGTEQPTDAILLEIRDDYRKAKKQLKSYNKFIDLHPQLIIIGTPLLLLLVLLVVMVVVTSSANGGIGIIVFTVSLVLFLSSLVLAVVCFRRSSSVNKILDTMQDLRTEIVSYQRIVALGLAGNDILREEIGLFQEHIVTQQNETVGVEPIVTQQNEMAQESGGLILLGWITLIVQFIRAWGAISIIASIAALIISIVLVVSKNPKNKSHGKVILVIWIIANSISFIVAYNNMQQAQQTQKTQACMTSVSNTYDPTVPNAAGTEIAGLQACQPITQ